MAAVNVTINGVICDLYGRTISGPVKIVGELMRTGLGVGGGPIFPEPPPEGGEPPGIWPGPGDPDYPGKPPGSGDGKPPGIWGGGNEPFPTPPIYLPPQVPPGMKPPETPPPGTVTPVPPPAGQAGWPVNPMVQPEYVVFNYPGFGPVVVTAPPHAEPAA